MFIVTEADAAAIHAAFHEAGELSAMVELQRRFPGITDRAKARECARTTAGWLPVPEAPCPVTPLHPGKTRWLLSGSGVVTGTSRDQGCDERTEQGLAASACVVHELEEAEIKRQLVL